MSAWAVTHDFAAKPHSTAKSPDEFLWNRFVSRGGRGRQGREKGETGENGKGGERNAE